MAEFVYSMLKELDRMEPNEEKGWDGFVMSVGRWVKDGEPLAPTLSRQTLKLEDGVTVARGNKGFRVKDLQKIKENWKEIIQLMQNPPAHEEPKKEEASPADEKKTDDELEEVPF